MSIYETEFTFEVLIPMNIQSTDACKIQSMVNFEMELAEYTSNLYLRHLWVMHEWIQSVNLKLHLSHHVRQNGRCRNAWVCIKNHTWIYDMFCFVRYALKLERFKNKQETFIFLLEWFMIVWMEFSITLINVCKCLLTLCPVPVTTYNTCSTAPDSLSVC